jgi:autotransporter-associated beta strand protein
LSAASFAVSGGTIRTVLTGTGALTKTGTSIATLTGANTFSGGTTISGGTLVVNSFGLVGSVTNNATLEFSQESNGTFAGTISGSGQVVKSGTGRVGLTGTNVYTGGTTINAGTLIVTTSSLPGAVVNNATLQFNQDGRGTFKGVISGTGAVLKTGLGAAGLTGVNTYTGGTTVDAGTLVVTTASLPGNVTNNAILQFNQSSRGTYLGLISGTGAVVKTGTGAVGLTGANTYAGGTTVSEGTLLVTTSSLPGNVVNNATLQFNQASRGTYAGVISGTGAVLKTGSGAVGLTGANTYAGGTTISDGTLFVTTSSLPTGSVVNNATLQFNQTATGVFNGTISGSGTVIKGGRGSMSFTADNTYTGTTELTGGTLFIEGNQGSASGNVNVASGATLGGTGTIGGNTTVATGGRHRIGSALGSDLTGQQTFLSSLAYQGGSTAFWRLNDNTTDTADYDRAVVGTVLTVDPTAVFNLSFNTAGSTVVWADNFWSTEKLDTDGWLVYNAATLSVAGDIFALNPPSRWIDSTGVSLQAARPDYVFAFYQDSAEGNLYLNYIYSP